MAKTVAERVAEARTRIENLTVDEVVAEREKGGVVLVDIREEEERAQWGVIPGALHVPWGMLEDVADPSDPAHCPELEPNRRIILHCAGGVRSAVAVETLEGMGFENVAHLDGGFVAWEAAGRPIELVDGASDQP